MNTNIATPKLSIYHPNSKGTGAAIVFELKPAHGNSEGAIFARIANQKDSLHFDWENGITVRLGFQEVCEILRVLHGETEEMGFGKGCYVRTPKYATVVNLKHVLEPYCGYTMSVYQEDAETKENRSTRITFTPSEALGISIAFENALKDIVFGTGFEATSIALARDEEQAHAAEYSNTVDCNYSIVGEILKAIPDSEREPVYKAIAKVSAVATLCLAYGKEHNERISKAVDVACGDAVGDIADDEIKLGKDVLKDNHPIWRYVVIEHGHIK